ncbi:Dihydrodipicolinate synthase/N-acetylneuraminate lyase [Actinacidiphila yanglinensis]|uniref:Dihydrodipicolinate synthase/N-acetylneuraminate lyase n=1 Tax=Actinacidiphila yanglinensis TaxID=310779 RepID=A0A1H6DBA7_9ACTN|nr:dihydrodipicolinate synthase family protein [Actinacidiphila yanglinensis]SEG82442.1 Dihydrodipicolinate synthase/N-acetylneuraminate lyase [Actinacidiphila yanglinensis]
MDALTSQTLRGIWSPTLLPLDEDDAIDFGRLEEALEAVLGSGVHGVYTNGTAGEFHTLDEGEYDRLHALVAARCTAAGVPYQLGASHPGGRLSLDRIRRAATLRPGAIQVVLPDWLPLQADEAVAALRGMAAAADGVPLVLYNPPYAKTRVTPALLSRIGQEVPQVVGLKVPGVEVARGLTDRFAVFVAGHTLATGHRAGAAGSYSNVACMSPAGAVRWYAQMATDPVGAAEVEDRLRGFLERHVAPLAAAGYSDPALDKALCAVGGWSRTGTRVRWPHRWVPAEAVPALREAALAAVPDLLADPVGTAAAGSAPGRP